MLDPNEPTTSAIHEVPLPRPPGDSATQRDAESIILAALGKGLGLPLVPKRIHLGDGTYVEVDGVSDNPPVL